MSILLQFCLISNMRLFKSRMLSLWWFTHQISNSTCGRALSCFGIGWQILQTDFLWSTGAFSDLGAGVRLGNFWKNRVWVRQGAAIKNLLKVFLFIFSIYFKGKNIFLFWESMQTTSFSIYIFYMLSFSFQIYFQRQETQNKKENTKEATNIQNKIEEWQI